MTVTIVREPLLQRSTSRLLKKLLVSRLSA